MLPQAAHAQDWVTPEVCAVDEPFIAEQVFEPPGRAALEAEAATIPNGTGRLWQIASPDGKVSHLWGTMHSSSRHVLDVPQEVIDILLASRSFAVERDFRHLDRDSYRRWIFWDGVFQQDRFLSVADILPDGADPNIIVWIYARLNDRGINSEDVSLLSLGGLMEILLTDPCEDFVGGTRPILDDYLATRAHIANMPVRGLEGPHDIRDHVNANEATASALIGMFGAYLMPVTSNAERATSFALYRQGRISLMMAWDAAFLAEMLGPDAEAAVELGHSYLIDDRNRTFVNAALPDVTEGGAFLAVGAFHLPGEAGMVALFRDAGFTVTRVPLPGEAP